MKFRLVNYFLNDKV